MRKFARFDYLQIGWNPRIFGKITKIIYRANPWKSRNPPRLSFSWFSLKNVNLGLKTGNFEISRNSAQFSEYFLLLIYFSPRNVHFHHRCITAAGQEQMIWKKRYKEEVVSNRHHQKAQKPSPKFRKAWKPVQNHLNAVLRETIQSVLEQMIRFQQRVRLEKTPSTSFFNK